MLHSSHRSAFNRAEVLHSSSGGFRKGLHLYLTQIHMIQMHKVLGCLFLCICPIFLTESRAQQPGTSANEYLDACIKSQSALDKVSMETLTNAAVDSLAAPADFPKNQRITASVKRDLDLFDMTTQHVFIGQHEGLSQQRTVVVMQDYAINAGRKINSESKMYKSGLASTDLQKTRCDILTNPWAGGFYLDGYFATFPCERLAELLKQTDGTTVRDATIEGAKCKVVEGSTPYGKISLWLAAQKGFLPVQVTFDKGPEDLLGDQQKVATATFPRAGRIFNATAITGRLDQVEFATIDKTFVPVAGQFTLTLKSTGTPDYTRVFAVKRTKIDLHPTFKGTDAFKPPIAPGSPVTLTDGQKSGVSYIWDGKRVVPAYVEFSGNAVMEHGRRSYLVVLVWSVIGSLLLCLSIWWWVTKKKRSSPA